MDGNQFAQVGHGLLGPKARLLSSARVRSPPPLLGGFYEFEEHGQGDGAGRSRLRECP
jgi:hypothetical protein